MAVFDDTQPWQDKLLLYPHKIKWQNNVPVHEKGEPERLEIPEAEPLLLECEHFLNSFTNNNKPQTDGIEGLRVLKILNAAQRFLDKNGCTIKISKFSIQPQAKLSSQIFVHDTAVIDENCDIGAGTKIWHFSHVLSNSRIGENCSIGQNVVIGPDVTIGKHCKIQNNVSVYKGVTLGDGVFCGPSMVFTNIYNPRAEISKMDQIRPTLVKKGATIGANATIVCGITLGRYSFIGAGSLVNKNVPNYALIVGNPAKHIGWACECGERLSDDLECTSCGNRFEKKPEGLVKS
ncbi:MAG: hypothetical protein KAT52_05035 [Desulfobacterales bacterium]|nr:hypothetical protein [Desulfobacterales bacterium]